MCISYPATVRNGWRRLRGGAQLLAVLGEHGLEVLQLRVWNRHSPIARHMASKAVVNRRSREGKHGGHIRTQDFHVVAHHRVKLVHKVDALVSALACVAPLLLQLQQGWRVLSNLSKVTHATSLVARKNKGAVRAVRTCRRTRRWEGGGLTLSRMRRRALAM